MSRFKINNNTRKPRFFNDEMTQQNLAKLVGVTRQTINSLEKGKYPPSHDLAFRIALAFDVPLDSVFSYDYKEKGD